VYVEDVAEALIQAAVAPALEVQVYNLGSGVGTRFIDMANWIVEMIPGTELRQVEWPSDRYFVETGDYISDITLLTQTTGWRPKTSMRDGIAKTIEYYRRHRGHYW